MKRGTIKNVKLIKRFHAYKDYGSTNNVDILNSFNLELQFQSTEYAIKNKVKGLLPEPRGFKFVTRLALQFKKL